MPPKKLAAIKKPAAKKIVKRSAAPATTPTKKVAKKRRNTVPSNVDFDPDTDMGKAWEEIKKGGESRTDVMHRVRAALDGTTTRSGNPKPVPTIMNHVMRRARAAGYEVVQSWSLKLNPDAVPPAAEKTTTKKAAKKMAKVKSTPAEAPVKKRIVKKPAAKKIVRKKA